MTIQGDYVPSTQKWVRDQVEAIESSGGRQGTTLRGMPVVVMTNRGAQSGAVRKTPVMRVEHEGSYAAVASQGGSPKNPYWYHNLKAHPVIQLQDGPLRGEYVAREISGDERAEWWERAVRAYPDYADYQLRTTRQIPVFLLEPTARRSGAGTLS